MSVLQVPDNKATYIPSFVLFKIYLNISVDTKIS